MARYRKITTEERTARREREQQERLRAELREFTLREIRSVMNTALRDVERELSSNLKNYESMQAGRLIFRSDQTASSSASSSAVENTNWGTFLSNTVLRLFSSRTTTRTNQSAATETSRSSQENQFYRESRSQREAAISQLSGGGARNL